MNELPFSDKEIKSGSYGSKTDIFLYLGIPLTLIGYNGISIMHDIKDVFIRNIYK
jgi:hypothetical protein